MRHIDKRSAGFSVSIVNCPYHFLRLCLVICFAAGSLLLAACAAVLPAGDQSQLELIETIRDPRRSDFQTVLSRITDVNFVDESGKTPLIYAIERNKTAQILALLKRGADPAVPDVKGYTALHYAAVLPDSEPLKVMLAAGIKPDIPGSSMIQEKTSLMEAARIGEMRNVELLLKYGADPNVCDARGRTPLMFAATAPKYSTRLVKLLLEKGANHFQSDDQGNIALFMAIAAKNQNAALHLLSLFSDFDKNNEFTAIGLAAMKQAIDFENIEIVNAILAKKLPVNSDLSSIYKSLRFATMEGWYEILAEKGVIKDGKTPLFWAAKKDNAQIIKILLDNGADPTAKDHAGTYPADYTRQRESSSMLNSAAKKKRAEQLKKLEEHNKR